MLNVAIKVSAEIQKSKKKNEPTLITKLRMQNQIRSHPSHTITKKSLIVPKRLFHQNGNQLRYTHML